jgi:hypothetical protein
MAARRAAPLLVADERALFRLRPGAAEIVRDPRTGTETLFTVNAAGYRGPEVEAGRPRIAVYGDSFVEARFTPQERTFAARLAAELGAPFMAVNAGVSGYGPDQAAVRMARELPSLAPRAVVLAVYAGNDGGDVVRNRLLRLDVAGRVEAGTPCLDDAQAHALGEPGLALRRAARWIRRRVGAEEGAGTRSLRWALDACRREHEAHLDDGACVENLFLDHYDADLALEPDSPSARHKRALLEAALARARDAVAGRPLLVVAIPDVRDVCRACGHRREAGAYPGYRPAALTDAVTGAAEAARLAHLDLFAEFEGRGEHLYDASGHWNDEGQALAARLAAARLREMLAR